MIPTSWLGLLIFILIFPGLVFAACGMLGICLKPDSIRPPWLDWGLDKEEKDEIKDEKSSL
jgi:hypothetical protein